MLNFEFFLPTHFVFGKDAECQAGAKIKALGAPMC